MTPWMKLILGTLLTIAVLELCFIIGLAVSPAFSQTRTPTWFKECSPRPDLVARLAAEYGEAQIGMGPQGVSPGVIRGEPGAILLDVEIFLNPDTGTWTVFTTRAGRSCIKLTGKNWRWGPPVEGDPA